MKRDAITFMAMADNSRRGTVTKENERESLALKKLWKAHQSEMAARGEPFTQENFAAKYGVSQSAVTHCLNGRMAISKELAVKFAEFLGNVSVAEFSERLQREIDGLAPNVIGLGGRSLTLANEFDRLPETFADGGTKEQFLHELLRQIWRRPHLDGKPEQAASPSPVPRAAQKRRHDKGHVR
jgi:transcriptional regulator with XRE-family HTH domain